MDIREEIKKLSQAEKILLVEQIWDDIAVEREFELSEMQKKELRRRVKLEDAGKMKFLSLEESRERIKTLKKNV